MISIVVEWWAYGDLDRQIISEYVSLLKLFWKQFDAEGLIT